MARINISIQEDLRAKMADHKTNWSKVCASAIEAELTKAPDPSGKIKMLARLNEQTGAPFIEMRSGGRQWAQEKASFEQLHRLATIRITDKQPTYGTVLDWKGPIAFTSKCRSELEERHLTWTWQGFFAGVILDGYQTICDDDASSETDYKRLLKDLKGRNDKNATCTLVGKSLRLEDGSTINVSRHMRHFEGKVNSISLSGSIVSIKYDDQDALQFDLKNESETEWESWLHIEGRWFEEIIHLIPELPSLKITNLEESYDLVNHPDATRLLDAFYEGALEAWNEVKDELPADLVPFSGESK